MERANELRDLLKVCKPEPLTGTDFEKFHVETSAARGQNSASQLSDYFQVNIDDPKKVLFMGHRGSGKSTELWQVRQFLSSSFSVVSFSIRDEIDITDLSYVDLVFVILDKLFEKALNDNISIEGALLDNLYDYWHTEQMIETLNLETASVAASAEAKIGFLNSIRASVKGVLSTGKETKKTVRNVIEPKLSQLIAGTNDLILAIKKGYEEDSKTPILIIEDLDKLDIPVAEELFLNHRNILTGLHIHIVYTFPIFLHYSEKFNMIKDSFDLYELLSMIKVANKNGTVNEEGMDVIRSIIEKRTSPKTSEVL